MSSPHSPEIAKPPSVSVIIPVYRGGADFRRCLAGIAALSTQPDEVIVVVDGAEDDGSGSAAESMGARLLRLPVRSGPSAARNLGAKAATGEVLFFLDADVIPAPAVVGQVQAAFRLDPGLTALFGSYDDAPGDEAFLSQYRNLLHHYTHQTAEQQAHTFWGACGAIRRQAFIAVGGFDETYRAPCIEDIELGHRLVRAGHRIQLFKEIQVKHLKRWDAPGMLRTDILLRALPWARLLLRDRQIPNDLNLRLASRFSAILAWVFALSLAAMPWWAESGYAALAAAAGLILLNAPFYRFLARCRGRVFALRAMPWHWLYFLYASGTFGYAWLAAKLNGTRSNPLGEVSSPKQSIPGSDGR